MPDFSRPEYASYVQFCWDHRNEPLFEDHRFSDGDWAVSGSDRPHYAYIYMTDLGGGQGGDLEVWLLSLADWLETLNPYGEWLLYREGLMPNDSGRLRYVAEIDLAENIRDRRAGPDVVKAAAIPEEALARLYEAISRPS